MNVFGRFAAQAARHGVQVLTQAFRLAYQNVARDKAAAAAAGVRAAPVVSAKGMMKPAEARQILNLPEKASLKEIEEVSAPCRFSRFAVSNSLWLFIAALRPFVQHERAAARVVLPAVQGLPCQRTVAARFEGVRRRDSRRRAARFGAQGGSGSSGCRRKRRRRRRHEFVMLTSERAPLHPLIPSSMQQDGHSDEANESKRVLTNATCPSKETSAASHLP